jgi:hypothetical protein
MGERHFDEGGEVSDDELMRACAGELCDALEKKDHKAIVDAMRAIMSSIRS